MRTTNKKAVTFLVIACLATISVLVPAEIAGCSASYTTQPGTSELAASRKVVTEKRPDGTIVVSHEQSETGKAKSPSVNEIGEKISGQFNATTPDITLPGGFGSQGGDTQSKFTAETISGVPILLVGAVIFAFAGVACIVWLRIVTTGVALIAFGVSLAATHYYPWVLLFGVAGVAAYMLYSTYVWKQSNGALSTMVKAVSNLPENIKKKVKSKVAEHAHNGDSVTIEKTKAKIGR